MPYSITDAVAGMQAIAETSTTRTTDLGRIVRASDPTLGAGEFIYAQGVASTVVGSAVIISNGLTTLTTTTSRGAVGFAMSANVANQFGWYQISGYTSALAAAAAVNNAVCYATLTVGSIDDAVTTGAQIDGAKFAATAATGACVISIQRPSMNGQG